MRVLVTRPQPGAAHTAAQLEAAGHEAVVLPLTETIGVPVKAASLPACDATAVTSANALRFTPRGLLPALAARPLFAVGGKSAEAARLAGFASVTEGPGEAADLARLITERLPAGASVLYLCGRLRRPGFEAALDRAGIAANPVETYDVLRIDHADEDVRNAVGPGPIDAVLLYSAVAAAAYRGLAGRPALVNLFGAPRILCLSVRIAEAYGTAADSDIEVAATPDENALFALLAA